MADEPMLDINSGASFGTACLMALGAVGAATQESPGGYIETMDFQR